MESADGNALVAETKTYILKLYVAGDEQNSRIAQDNLTRICDEYLKGQCQIEKVDVLIDFATALKDRIFVTPTLVLAGPGPRVTVVGNLADKERVVSALHLRFYHETKAEL